MKIGAWFNDMRYKDMRYKDISHRRRSGFCIDLKYYITEELYAEIRDNYSRNFNYNRFDRHFIQVKYLAANHYN